MGVFADIAKSEGPANPTQMATGVRRYGSRGASSEKIKPTAKDDDLRKWLSKTYKLLVSIAAFFAFAQVANAAGTISLSLTQQFDSVSHLPLAKGQLFFIQAGTTSTPQNAFQDSALTIPYPNPLTLDAGARIPQLFFADGQIKIRLTNAAGIVQLSADNLQVIGASSGGGGGGSVDPTTILQTGHIEPFYGTGVLTGFVRLNGRTIGSATSGATERANADAQALFQYLWSADPNLAVSTGRGISANADWVANKQLTLPDARGRSIAALDDMGNAAAGRLTSTYFGTTSIGACVATTLGCAGGSEFQTLGLAQIPTGIQSQNANTFSIQVSASNIDQGISASSTGGGGSPINSVTAVGNITANGNVPPGSVLSTSFNTGGGAHPIVSPLLLVTIYIKL